MSNHLAIATVTATLQRLLQVAVQQDVEGARVTTLMPNQIGEGSPETGVNLYLYHVNHNPALQNNDAVPLRSRNKVSSRRQTALELNYLLSFYGNNTELEPQRLMGSIVQTFSDRTLLSTDMIRDATTDSTFSFLANSDLAEQLQQLQILPVDLELEEISKIWSAFFQTSYLLSMGYKVRVVMIDGMEPAERALPVRDRSFGRIMPFASQPVINEILPLAGKLAPILANSTLRIRGQQLSHAATTVRIGGVEVTPVTVSHREITLPLTTVPQHALHPGIQTLQVLHSQTAPIANNAGQLLAPIRSIVESNGTPFVLRPTITQLVLTNVVGNEDDPRDATLQITLDLSVDPGQRVNVGLNEWTVQSPAVYFFDGPNRSEATAHLTIPLYNIRAGEYLVRVVVDGAESLLTPDENPRSETFQWYSAPKVQVP
ncbi:MAG: DUF4255 domain-containing protein [Cyanobacteria bacterium J06635_15]